MVLTGVRIPGYKGFGFRNLSKLLVLQFLKTGLALGRWGVKEISAIHAIPSFSIHNLPSPH